jgi:elongation factor P
VRAGVFEWNYESEKRERSMPQINAGEFRKGVKVVLDGEPYNMLECNFVKPGKGQALYKCRLQNLLKNTILDRTYKSGESLEAADVRMGEGQFLYRERDAYVFMDQESYEQYTVPGDIMGDGGKWLLDGAICNMMYWNDRVIEVNPPPHVNMKVTYTEPAVRGNSSGNITKEATLETGVVIQVPAFIDMNDMVRIDTRTGEYVERVRT